MPPTHPLAELRQNLEAQIRENHLPEALNQLLAELPEGSETHRIVSALIARLNATNKERYRNTISSEEYQRRVDQVSADLFDLIAGLTEADFEEPEMAGPASAKASAGKASKHGSVLYRVPQVMPIQKPTRCTIRVAVDEDAILENILLDEHVHIKSRIEISDVMSAELIDAEGGIFNINPLNKHTQLVRDTGYTEWNFSVTPLREGVHQLLVKVSIMEIVPGYAEPIPREVSVMETVTIVTEAVAPSDSRPSEFKSSGQSFAFQSTSTGGGQYEYAPPEYTPPAVYPPSPQMEGREPNPRILTPIPPSSAPEPPFWGLGRADVPDFKREEAPPIPQGRPDSQQWESHDSPASLSRKSAGRGRGLRALAILLAFLVLTPAATWAFAPDWTKYQIAFNIQGSHDAETAFIEKHPNSPRLEKAYFERAKDHDQLGDLRAYQNKYPQGGKYETEVLTRITAHEIKAIDHIRQQPDALKIRQFVTDFPESERLPEIKQAVDARADRRAELLPVVEKAYVNSMELQPSPTKVTAYVRDFPRLEQLNEVANAAAAKPEVLAQARPVLDDAITRKAESAATPAEVRQVLLVLETAGSSAAATKVEKLVQQKPIRAQVQQQVRQSVERVKQREQSVGVTSSHPDTAPMSEAERHDWEAAEHLREEILRLQTQLDQCKEKLVFALQSSSGGSSKNKETVAKVKAEVNRVQTEMLPNISAIGFRNDSKKMNELRTKISNTLMIAMTELETIQ